MEPEQEVKVEIPEEEGVDEPDTSSSKQSWKFCNEVTLPRSEVVFFVQFVILVVVLTVCFVKILILGTDCDEKAFWFSICSLAVGFIFPTPLEKVSLRK